MHSGWVNKYYEKQMAYFKRKEVPVQSSPLLPQNIAMSWQILKFFCSSSAISSNSISAKRRKSFGSETGPTQAARMGKRRLLK